MKKIESLSNEKIKLCSKIISSSAHRREQGLFFLEGLRLCRDAMLSGIRAEFAFFTGKAIEKNPEQVKQMSSYAAESFEISEAVARKLACTESSQGIFMLCALPEKSTELDTDGKYIALECIQDPANLGAICRTAEALGISGAILYSCCDRFSPKAQRAAMGSLLRLPVIECDSLSSLLQTLRGKGMKVYATTPDENVAYINEVNMSSGVVAVIGNEGNGVSDEVFAVCDKLTIPMKGRAESLNAAMAAAITMWEMMR